MGRFRDTYSQHFGMLSEERAELLEFLIINTDFPNGWEPDEEDIRDQCERFAGKLSLEGSIYRTCDRHPPHMPDRI